MNTFTLNDVALYFRNFSGQEARYNPAGHRNFMVLLDKTTAQGMKRNGWKVREFSIRGETGTVYGIPVKITPVLTREEDLPEIKIIEYNGHERVLGVDEWASLDSLPAAQHATVIINPHVWEMHGRKGITAFLQTLIIDIRKE